MTFLGHTSLQSLLDAAKEKNISIKDYENFVLLKYDQIFSPATDPLVMQCRGIIIDKATGHIIGRAYPRFFNYGQYPDITEKFEFDGSTIYEKLDGSVIKIWFNCYSDRWEIATNGTALGESEQAFFPSFREAVLRDGFGLTEDEFQSRFANMDRAYSHVFEYCSNYNQIVTFYESGRMYYITSFNNETGAESYFNKVFDSVKALPCPVYNFNSKQDMLNMAEALTDLKEGFVTQDVNGLRIKIKSSAYVRAHHMRGEGALNQKRIAECVVQNEQDEFLTYFPNSKEMFEPVIDEVGSLLTEMSQLYDRVKFIEDQKEFAMSIRNCSFSGVLFEARKKKIDVLHAWGESKLEFKVKIVLGRLSSTT
jgi:hypothetical protein